MSEKTALILGGSGVIGQAAARTLLAQGWRVRVTGRAASHFPAELTQLGAAFLQSDRTDTAALRDAIGSGADLVVDAACYTASDARLLLPFLPDVGSTVMISSKGVYADQWGRHTNSREAPHFENPIREDHQTVAPREDIDYHTAEGYGANKLAAEQVYLAADQRVSVIRASKVHGKGARRPREWMYLKRALERHTHVFFTQDGAGVDHPTAAANLAALISVAADKPGTRVLNSADPDAPTAAQLAETIAAHVNWRFIHIYLPTTHEPSAKNGFLGYSPWNSVPPIILDTSASLALGYTPVGTYAQTIGEQLDWLIETPEARPASDDPFFAELVNYSHEDAYLETQV